MGGQREKSESSPTEVSEARESSLQGGVNPVDSIPGKEEASSGRKPPPESKSSLAACLTNSNTGPVFLNRISAFAG